MGKKTERNKGGKSASRRKQKASKEAKKSMSQSATIMPITQATAATFREWLAKVASVSEEQATRILRRIKKRQ